MTRQNELNEAWCKYRGKCSTEILHALAFALRWCDQHPNWISVEDELPKEGDSVIIMQDVHGNKHFTACEFLSAKQLANVTDFHVKSDAYLGVSKNAEVTLGAVTHWMPLPQPQPPEHIAGISNKTACPDCFVAQYPPCGKGIPCCKCHEEGCNSRQPCPKKGGEQ